MTAELNNRAGKARGPVYDSQLGFSVKMIITIHIRLMPVLDEQEALADSQ